MDTATPVSEPNTKPFLGAFDLFRPSIQGLMLNIKTFVLLIVGAITPAAAAVPLAFVAGSTDVEFLRGATIILSSLLGLSTFVLLCMIMPALFVVQLQSVRGHVIQPMVAFREGLKHFWRFYGATILQLIILTLAFIALIVPYFFMLRRYILVQYYVIDRNMGVMDALRLCAADSLIYRSPLWGLVGVTVLLSLAGGIPIISLVIWIPTLLYALAPAVRYSEIQTASKAAEKNSDLSSVLGRSVV